MACGGIGTTRLVLGSLGVFDQSVYLQESVQFVMPTVSMRPADDPRSARNFTLNQFNLLYDATGEGVDLCQVHFYDYNPAFLDSLPGVLRRPTAEPALAALLRRISVGLGYLPGWASPRVRVVARRPSGGSEQLPALEVDRESEWGMAAHVEGPGADHAQGRTSPGLLAGSADGLCLRSGQELPLWRELPPWWGPHGWRHGQAGAPCSMGPHPLGGCISVPDCPCDDVYVDDHGQRSPHRQRIGRSLCMTGADVASSPTMADRPIVAITGASGYLGQCWPRHSVRLASVFDA